MIEAVLCLDCDKVVEVNTRHNCIDGRIVTIAIEYHYYVEENVNDV